MSQVDFPSGQWTGFYNYFTQSKRFLTDLILEFRNGMMSGEGSDGIGLFEIHGRYCQKEAECSWVKSYIGKHSVMYSGYREGKGIWGTWVAGSYKGGFHIWPIGQGSALEELTNEVEEELPAFTELQKQSHKATRSLCFGRSHP